MFGMLTKKQVITGVFAGLAALSTFFAAPKSAEASYSVPVPNQQHMKYKDSDGPGTLAIYKTGWNSKYKVWEIDVELCQNGYSFCGYGYRWRVYNPCDPCDYACDYVHFVIFDCYGCPWEFKGEICYDGHCDIYGGGHYGKYGTGNLSKWFQVYD
jgi:hypothetical protein